MGYNKVPTIYDLVFEDEELQGLVIRMKAVKIGKVRKLLRLLNSEQGHSDEQMDEMFKLMAEALVSWNLEECDNDGNPLLDDYGRPIPIPATLEGIEDQEFPFILQILSTWMDGMTGVSDELGKDSGSGVISPVPLPTMESL